MPSSGRVRVLLAHEDDATRTLLRGWLAGWGYDVADVADGARALDALRGEDAPRFVLVGDGLAGASAADVGRAAHGRPTERYVYAALLGAPGAACDADACLAAQFDDFLASPLDPNVLRLRLEAGRRVAKTRDDLIASREALRSLAASDPLTGMWNRETTLAILRREIGRAHREDRVVAVLMVDLDHFKRINDDFGHQAGDEVLREVASRMSSVIRPYDAAGRYGGEEFIFVLPGCDRAGAGSAAERILEAVSAEPIGLQSVTLRLTVSIGISANGPEPELDPDQMVRAADAALYRAKRAGRNRIEVDRRAAADEPAPDVTSPRESAQAIVERLRTSVAARDARTVCEESRELRRIASAIGARGVVHLTRTLDARADAGHWDTARGAVDAIDSEVLRFTAAALGAG